MIDKKDAAHGNKAGAVNRSSPAAEPFLFKTPFSREYWKLASMELKDTKMLIFAALMIALRVAMKAVKIPVGPFLDINTAFLVNAVGAMSFGPVAAILAAAVTDTLGCLLFPSGPYFFPFIFVEIAGSLVFALLLYRTEVTVGRVVLSRFCIDFFVNIVLQTPIMALYYQMVLGRYYTLVDLPRIVKNLALFPFESAVLIIVLKAVAPPLKKTGLLKSRFTDLKLTKKTVAILVSLTIISAGAAMGYSWYTYNHTSLSASYSAEVRLKHNEELNEVVLKEHSDWDGESTVTIIESAIPRLFHPEITYTIAIYEADTATIEERAASGGNDITVVRGYSKSPAARDEALRLRARATVVINETSGEVLSYEEMEAEE